MTGPCTGFTVFSLSPGGPWAKHCPSMLHKINETFAPIQKNVTWASTTPVNWWQQLTICLLDPDSPTAWGFQWRKEFTFKRMWRQAGCLDMVFYLTPTCFPGLPFFSVQSWTLCFIWKISALQIRAGGPRFRGHPGDGKEGGPHHILLSGCLQTHWEWLGLFWRARRELVSSVLREQLSHDCPIKMIQAEWYFMIYGIRPPVPQKAWY